MSAALNLRRWGATAAATAAVLMLLGWGAASAEAADARYEGSSEEGARVFFSTDEKILPAADKDNHQDVYQRAGSVTSLVSFGPFGGNRPFDATYAGASVDGTHAYFTTAERLVQQDTDSALDVYERTAGTTVLVSRGVIGGGNVAADFAAASADGLRVAIHHRRGAGRDRHRQRKRRLPPHERDHDAALSGRDRCGRSVRRGLGGCDARLLRHHGQPRRLRYRHRPGRL